MNGLFQYVPGNSPLHRMNPVTKILLTLSVCIAAFLTDNLFVLLFLLVFDLMIGVAAGAARKAFSIFKGLFKVSLFLFVLQVLFIRRGNRLFWIVTDEGLLTAAAVVLRLLVVCLPLALILTVTQVSDIANAMVQVLHVPYAYAFTLTTAIRFIPQFMEEMGGIMESQTARGVEFDSKNVFKKLGMLFPLCAPLLISSVRRTGATATAAEVRGFNLRTRESGYKRYGFGLVDLAAVLISAALIVGAVLIP
ncbi:MAG: energy-coupling factor transporter transmembrane protein EcfT [Clostridia bacterium]|nr:energy-coupling factor transporter transmembrane protein EcfT [Clostridia bacterium]MCR4906120.1 energy-coupling factor transporter transmembrane protein EcfT [Clostridiales bacterium]